MIEIKCTECKNCDLNNDCCLIYEGDANDATEKCAEDNFKNYKK